MSRLFDTLFGAEVRAALDAAFANARERFGDPKPIEGVDGTAPLWCRRTGTTDLPVPIYVGALVPPGQLVKILFEVQTPDGRWRPLLAVNDERFFAMADLATLIETHIEEAYRPPARPVSTRLPFDYRAVPPVLRVLIHNLLVRWRKARRPNIAKGVFPIWDAPGLFEAWMTPLGHVPTPTAVPLPFVFSHDVDGAEQLPFAKRIAGAERERGVVAGFFLPAKLLRENAADVDAIAALGHEIGVHGVRHDNRQLLYAPDDYARQLDDYRPEIERYNATGYRAPCLLTSPALRKVLSGRFAYDSSQPDTDVYAEAGDHHGCAHLRPFTFEGLARLPVTLPLDDRLHTLGSRDFVRLWREKMTYLQLRGGAAVLCTHANDLHYPQGFEPILDGLLQAISDLGDFSIMPPATAAQWSPNRDESR
ncbi:MAG: polysaccharide deacetylase family protein [Deltaproteobacteria bacterium]|nr:polysaccharide deacetylase family protein [Deltaproteobacteria bacterium]